MERSRVDVGASGRAEAPPSAEWREDDVTRETASLLGGLDAGTKASPGALHIHDILVQGLPGAALTTLLGTLRVFAKSDRRLEAAIGFSTRTMQRKGGQAGLRLSSEQAGRAWQFAEVLARATKVLGSQDAAERWLERPAIGLDHRSPIDLLATPPGVKMVTDYLGRIEYGVYT